MRNHGAAVRLKPELSFRLHNVWVRRKPCFAKGSGGGAAAAAAFTTANVSKDKIEEIFVKSQQSV